MLSSTERRHVQLVVVMAMEERSYERLVRLAGGADGEAEKRSKWEGGFLFNLVLSNKEMCDTI